MSLRRTLDAVATWGRMVKLSHTIFALPFALSAAALAAAAHGWDWNRLVWILVAMFAARNAAMGFNRLVDHDIDAANPRTSGRELPAGHLGRPAVWTITIVLALLFVYAAYRLDVLWFAPIVLVVIFGYSFTKRFTWGSHLALGVALGLAPIGAWMAVTGSLALTPLLMGAAVTCWVAGFDLIYACQDIAFDRSAGLHSFPARFGVAAALRTARLLHVATLALLAAVGLVAGLHPLYWIGWLAVAVILVLEHRVVRPDDLSRLDIAFFNLNASVSVAYFAGVLAALAAG